MSTRRLFRGKRNCLLTCTMFTLGLGSLMLLSYAGSTGESEGASSAGTSRFISHLLASSSLVNFTAFTDDVVLRRYDFDAKGHYVIVFVHIQKTGGTLFGRHLAENIFLPLPDVSDQLRAVVAPVCPCDVTNRYSPRCLCNGQGQGQMKNRRRRVWLVSRPSTGWLCGVHADWTELHECVPQALDRLERKRRYRQ